MLALIKDYDPILNGNPLGKNPPDVEVIEGGLKVKEALLPLCRGCGMKPGRGEGYEICELMVMRLLEVGLIRHRGDQRAEAQPR